MTLNLEASSRGDTEQDDGNQGDHYGAREAAQQASPCQIEFSSLVM
jgi:hypothetical protein